jgi:uncharacterized RDD family membrane protein YckC
MDDLLDEKTYETRKVTYATFYQRTAAWLLDLLLFIAVSYWIYYIFGGPGTYKDFLLVYKWHAGLVLLFYFIFLDGGEQNATFGKQVMDIRLLKEELGDISYKESAIHFVLSIFLFLGYFRMLYDPKRRTLADKIAKVIVITRK